MSNQFTPKFTGWIHEMARAESSPEGAMIEGLTQRNGPQQIIEENTVDFLTDLRGDFQEYTRIFNGLTEGGKKFAEIKIFNLTQGAADFMLYRNGIKLIVANTAHGVIQFSYNKHSISAPTAGNTLPSDVPPAEEILAQIGVFGTVNWICRGEKIDSEQVSRYFFSEFVRLTREQKKGKPNQKILLDQIKALLQEQGLSLE